MSFNYNINCHNDNILIEDTVSKWNYFITFDEEMRKTIF